MLIISVLSAKTHTCESDAGAAVGSFLLVTAIGALCYFRYTFRANKENIEQFLKDYNAQKPTRFTYSDIRMITNHFDQKLGEGGYGTVYKGKLSNEAYAAVKVLSNGNGSGEEFINEVNIIGRIHHVNVVRLVGFCAEGLTRALVYEFLENGSLEKFLFKDGSKSEPLSAEKLHHIALGVAQGIEYLHHGCDQQVLHFDIKPQNILLEHDFNPKISDFGLAKLCSKEQSGISITSGRGTMGYVAPEVLSRAFGRVSYKSDIYSYGMVLLEMVGGRIFDHMDINAEQQYMPQRIYDHLSKKENAVQKPEDNESKIMRKLTVVGLWCIQWSPADRPSMKTAVQMLEGDEDNLTMPPNPFSDANAVTSMKGDFADMIKQKLVEISGSM